MEVIKPGMSRCYLKRVLDEPPLARAVSVFQLQLPKGHHPSKTFRLLQAYVELCPQGWSTAKQSTNGQMCCTMETERKFYCLLPLSTNKQTNKQPQPQTNPHGNISQTETELITYASK